MSAADGHNSRAATNEPGHAGRRAAMAVLAQARTEEIAQALGRVGANVGFTDLRPAETGLIMLRGRTGGNGAPFNIGEATVTRAAVQLATGERGFAYVLGRDHKRARLAALCDALWQAKAYRQNIDQRVLTPLRLAQQQRLSLARAQTAATRVDFFTLVRGEDER